MKQIKNIFISASALALLASCAGDFDTNFMTDKPENVAIAEFVNQYNVLKEYAGDIKVGAETGSSSILDHGTSISQLTNNFNELTFNDLFAHKIVVDGNGNVTVDSKAANAISESQDAGFSFMGSSLCDPATTNVAYMNTVVSDTYIPGKPAIGEFKILDFEDMDIGSTFPGSGGATGTIVEDPKGESGHVAHWTTGYNHPQFNVTLPAGMTVGDIIDGYCDLFFTKSGWVPASVLKFFINGKQYGGDLGTSATAQNISTNSWARKGYKLDFTKFEIDEADKKATSFQLGIGDVASDPDYYFDNIVVKAHYTEQGHFEPRPIAEKKADALNAFDKYVQATVGEYGDKISNWIIASNALAPGNSGNVLLNSSVEENSKLFYWNEYLGDNFVADLAKAALAVNPALHLFYSDKNLDGDAIKTQNLVNMVKQWNENGAKLEGINAEIHLKYSSSTAAQSISDIKDMLKSLATTGLKIRLSGLDIQVIDESGNTRKISDLSNEERIEISDYLNNVILAYMEKVPAAQRYGICVSNYTGNDSYMGLWSSAYNRQTSYAGLADGLQNKKTVWGK